MASIVSQTSFLSIAVVGYGRQRLNRRKARCDTFRFQIPLRDIAKAVARREHRRDLHAAHAAVNSEGIDRIVQNQRGLTLGEQLLKLAIEFRALRLIGRPPRGFERLADIAIIQSAKILPVVRRR